MERSFRFPRQELNGGFSCSTNDFFFSLFFFFGGGGGELGSLLMYTSVLNEGNC